MQGAWTLFQGSFRPLVMSNGRDLVQMACHAYEDQDDPEDPEDPEEERFDFSEWAAWQERGPRCMWGLACLEHALRLGTQIKRSIVPATAAATGIWRALALAQHVRMVATACGDSGVGCAHLVTPCPSPSFMCCCALPAGGFRVVVLRQGATLVTAATMR